MRGVVSQRHSPAAASPKVNAKVEFESIKEKWQTLTPEERVQYCHRLAAEARRLSGAATPQLKQAYLDLATQWNELADEIGRSLGVQSGSTHIH